MHFYHLAEFQSWEQSPHFGHQRQGVLHLGVRRMEHVGSGLALAHAPDTVNPITRFPVEVGDCQNHDHFVIYAVYQAVGKSGKKTTAQSEFDLRA